MRKHDVIGGIVSGVIGGFAALGLAAAWVMFLDWRAQRQAHEAHAGH